MKTSTGREFNDDLLEELRLQTHAEYISDLHYSPYREEALIIVEMLPRELYSEAAWADMRAYLSEDRSEATVEEREQRFCRLKERWQSIFRSGNQKG